MVLIMLLVLHLIHWCFCYYLMYLFLLLLLLEEKNTLLLQALFPRAPDSCGKLCR